MVEQPQRPLLARLGAELSMLRAELYESAVLRWRLAMMELTADFRSARRLAILLAGAAVLGLAALPLTMGALAQWLDGYAGLSPAAWLLVFGASSAFVALAVGLFAWRRFRRRFIGLEQTIEELHEDVVWLREWLKR